MSDPMSAMFSNLHNAHFSGGHYNQQIINYQQTRPIDKLYAATAPTAVHTYDHGGLDQPKCHPGTRTAIFKRLKDWLKGLIECDALIMWLYGAAGAGKSAIAYDFAETCAAEGLLLGDFFFSKSDPSRSSVKLFVGTITHQAIRFLPSLKPFVLRVVDEEHELFDLRFESQLQKLIASSLRQIMASRDNHSPRLIIVDGLDECQDVGVQQRLITALLSLAQEMNGLGHTIRILITSRPEQHILTTFNATIPSNILSRIALSNNYTASSDIRAFITDQLRQVRNVYQSLPSSWPGDDAVQTLVQKSSGQFIYAKLAVNFIASGRYAPIHALNITLGLQSSVNTHDMPFAELDALYRCLLSQYGDIQSARFILGLRLLDRFTSGDVPNIAFLLNIEQTEVSCFVKHLSGVIKEYPTGYLEVQHASLVDFICDPARAREYHINEGELYNHLAICSLQRLAELLIHDGVYRDFGNLIQPLPSFLSKAAPTAELQQRVDSGFHLLCSKKAVLQSHTFWRIAFGVFQMAMPSIQSVLDSLLDQDLVIMTSWPKAYQAVVICGFSADQFQADVLEQLNSQCNGFFSVIEVLRNFERRQTHISDFFRHRTKLNLPPPSPYFFALGSQLLLDCLFKVSRARCAISVQWSTYLCLKEFLEKSAASQELARNINDDNQNDYSRLKLQMVHTLVNYLQVEPAFFSLVWPSLLRKFSNPSSGATWSPMKHWLPGVEKILVRLKDIAPGLMIEYHYTDSQDCQVWI